MKSTLREIYVKGSGMMMVFNSGRIDNNNNSNNNNKNIGVISSKQPYNNINTNIINKNPNYPLQLTLLD